MKNFCFLASLLLFSPSIWAQTTKIGYVRPDAVLASLPETKKIEMELRTFQTQIETEIKKKQTDFMAKRTEAEKLDPANTPPAVIQAKVKEIRALEEAYGVFINKAEGDMQKKKETLLGPVLAKIQKEIEVLAKAENFDLILDAGNEQLPVLLFAKPESDLTDRIIQKLGGTVPPKGN